MSKKKLTEQELNWLLDDAFTSIQIDQTIEKIWGKAGTRRMLNQYLKDNPDVKALRDQALIDGCDSLENDILNCHRKMDPKEAQIFSANAMKILAARKPEKYGNKLDVNMNQTISIAGNIAKANERLAQTIRDVTPALIQSTITPVIPPTDEDENEE